uniref:Peptidase S1 domain-containing protein n=1 Tax=Amphilophus citrinellus TaxID=61819 RepID=A0A3Q0TB97_AMPCI
IDPILLLNDDINDDDHHLIHSGKIVGGHEAVPHSRPYMVLLERHMSNGQIKYCGGFLLNEDFVMTAAHCQLPDGAPSLNSESGKMINPQ